MSAILLLIGGCLSPLAGDSPAPDQVSVKYQEGVVHGFLTLRTMQGKVIADGETSQTVNEGVVTSRLSFRFKDGSIYQDTTSFTQQGKFRLLKDHVMQKGPSFQTEIDSLIDASSGRVVVHSVQSGKSKNLEQHLDLPSDLCNGIIFTLIKNMFSDSPLTVSYLAFTPRPVVVHMILTKRGKDRIETQAAVYSAERFAMKVDIGGLRGTVARLLKKSPPDTEIWIADGNVPTVIASEGPLYGGGPVWRIDVVTPKAPDPGH